jgi:hypothetical protein
MIRKYFIVLILIILAGLFLRIYPFEAKSWIGDYDTLVVREALDIGQSIIEKDFSFLRGSIEYPFLIPYLLLFFYGLFYLAGVFMGLFQSSYDFINYLFFNVDSLYWYSRILVGLFGVLTIPLVYLITKKIFCYSKKNKVALIALVSSGFAAFSLLNVQFSQQIRPYVVVGFFILLSYYCYLVFLERKTFGYFILLAASVGLATGTFFSGCSAFVFLILANYLFFKKDKRFKVLDFVRSIFTVRFFSGLIIVLLAIFTFYPFLFLEFNSERVFIKNAEQGIVLSLGGLPFPVSSFGHGFLTMLKVFSLHEIGLGLSLAFLLIVFLFFGKSKGQKNGTYFNYGLIGWLGFVLPYGLVYGLLDDGPRYRLLVPLIPFIAIGMGVLLIMALNRLKNVNFKKIILFLAVVFLLIQFVQAFRLTQLIARPYSRDLASNWVEDNISPNQLIILQQPIPTLIPSKNSLDARLSLGGVLSKKELFLHSIDPNLYPSDSREILDFGLLANYKGRDILEVFKLLKEMKPDYFILSSRSIDSEKKGDYPEFKFILEHGHLVKRFSPFKNQQIERPLNFPSGLENPLVDLWKAKQLGPFVEIYYLDWEK